MISSRSFVPKQKCKECRISIEHFSFITKNTNLQALLKLRKSSLSSTNEKKREKSL